MKIIKRNGQTEEFSAEKVVRSLECCTGHELALRIARDVEEKVRDGTTTAQIHEIVLMELWEKDPAAAIRYSLRESMMKLGPAGYRFEDFYARLLQERGISPSVRQLYRGSCAVHELDVVYTVNGGLVFSEMKYHNAFGIYTGLKEAMYTYMRLIDLREAGHQFVRAELVTNTKISDDGIAFSSCRGMGVIGWKYPPGGGLERMIEQHRLYPVTSLAPMVGDEGVRELLGSGIITVKDLVAAYREGRLDRNKYESAYRISLGLDGTPLSSGTLR